MERIGHQLLDDRAVPTAMRRYCFFVYLRAVDLSPRTEWAFIYPLLTQWTTFIYTYMAFPTKVRGEPNTRLRQAGVPVRRG
jgi:hypothetical protein